MRQFLPPADLLEKISGVEEGLRKNQTGGRIAGVGLVASFVQAVAGFRFIGNETGRYWWVAVAGTLFAASAAVLARTRVWIHESSTPFRYTCSIAAFTPLESSANFDCGRLADALRFDLAERLNERIRRLSFLEQRKPGEQPTGEGVSQHIHIAGEILIRRRKGKTLWIDVAPKVRVGPASTPFTLAHSVSQTLKVTTPDKTDAVARQEVDPEDYDTILERLYFTLASHIYRQIESDIQKKVDLLPGKYLRATAYLNEADDYGNSNTLDGLDYAIRFYRSAMALYDPRLRRLPKGRVRRAAARLVRAYSRVPTLLRRLGAVFLPSLAKKDVRTAATEVGLANALLHRRTLAGMSGRRINPIYEAPRLTKSAIRRLERFPEDAPGRGTALFNAYVSRALAYFQLENPSLAVESLERARSVLPARYDQEPSYLYVQGLLEDLPASSIRFLRLAVERQPRFEVAHFELAVRSEKVWRTRPKLEEKVARVILDDYDEVLKLNPGNVAAAGHAAYILWLLGRPGEAKSHYEHGSEFKQIKPDTTIGELDYGMARVAVEQGAPPASSGANGSGSGEVGDSRSDALSRAYRHYLRAAAAQLLLGVSRLEVDVGPVLLLRRDERCDDLPLRHVLQERRQLPVVRAR